MYFFSTVNFAKCPNLDFFLCCLRSAFVSQKVFLKIICLFFFVHVVENTMKLSYGLQIFFHILKFNFILKICFNDICFVATYLPKSIQFFGNKILSFICFVLSSSNFKAIFQMNVVKILEQMSLEQRNIFFKLFVWAQQNIFHLQF
jgi:hypothetical protein